MPASKIPTELITPIVSTYLENHDEDYQTLALRARVHHDTLWTVIQGLHKRVDFDISDRLLCAMGLVHLWWREPLREVYYSVDLSEKGRAPKLEPGQVRCHAPGCLLIFLPRRGGSGGHNKQLYCSDRCRERTIKMRNGNQRREFNSRKYVCRHGHPRTPDNTEFLGNGTRRCRVCNRRATQEFRHRQREAV